MPPVTATIDTTDIGSPEVAAQLNRWAERVRCDNPITPPEGFTLLGEGSSRVAVLGPDGVVYKATYGTCAYVNHDEADIWAAMLRHPEFRRYVPRHRLIAVGPNTLTAVERLDVHRARTHLSPEYQAMGGLREHFRVGDMNTGNVGWRGDDLLLLDAGFASLTHNCTHCAPEGFTL